MDPNPSSPPTPTSDLPPSSSAGFDPTPAARQSTLRRPTANALTLEDDEGEAEDTQETGGRKRSRRPRTQPNSDVPLVKDAVGETLGESFESFLRTSVPSCQYTRSRLTGLTASQVYGVSHPRSHPRIGWHGTRCSGW